MAGRGLGVVFDDDLAVADGDGTHALEPTWRPVFLINVPVGLALLAIGPRLLPVTRRPCPAIAPQRS